MIDIISAFHFIPFLRKTKINSEDGVLILTENNFHKALKEHEPLLVKFYLPWCKRCRAFAPEFLKVGEMLKHSQIQLGQVDAQMEKALVREHRISAVPSVRLFRGGTYVTYFGLQRAENIAAWAKKQCEDC